MPDVAAARVFPAASGQHVTIGAGGSPAPGLPNSNAAHAVFALVKRTANSAWHAVLGAHAAPTSWMWGLEVCDTDQIAMVRGAQDRQSSLTLTASDGWCVIGYSRNASTAPRMHKCPLATGVWSHATAPNDTTASGTPTLLRFGTWETADELAGHIIAAAVVVGSLGADAAAHDATVEAWGLEGGLSSWAAAFSGQRWYRLDQNPKGVINDQGASGGTQTAESGTSVTTTALPAGFDDGTAGVEHDDAMAGTLTAAGAGPSTIAVSGAAAAGLAAGCGRVDSHAHTADQSGGLHEAGAAEEAHSAAATATGAAAAAGVGIDTHGTVDHAASEAALTGAGTGEVRHAASAAGVVHAAHVPVEAAGFLDAAAGAAAVSGAAADTHAAAATSGGVIDAAGAGEDTWTPPEAGPAHDDHTEGAVAVTAAASTAGTHTETRTATITTLGDATSIVAATDSRADGPGISGTHAATLRSSRVAAAVLHLAGARTGPAVWVDAATGGLTVTGAALDATPGGVHAATGGVARLGTRGVQVAA